MERTLDNTVNTVLESIFGKNGLQINMIFGFIILVVGIGMFLFSINCKNKCNIYSNSSSRASQEVL
ncbi:hypothetical protein C6A28_03230 [Streptococcus anginosus]|nr:hypothetical protein C6A28_03230 [Streptococcus anginosus]